MVQRLRIAMRVLLWIFLGFTFLGVGACSRTSDRFRLRGEITFDNQPILAGDILLTPDGTKGNFGPQGIAFIREGKYDTGVENGKGFAGGPTLIRVTGLTGPNGKLLCEHQIQADLPRADSTYNINVPREVNKPKQIPDI